MSRLTKLTSTTFGRWGTSTPTPHTFSWTSRQTYTGIQLKYVGYKNGYHWAFSINDTYPSSTNRFYRSVNGTTGWALFTTYTVQAFNSWNASCAGIEWDATGNVWRACLTLTPLDSNPSALTTQDRVAISTAGAATGNPQPLTGAGSEFSSTVDSGASILQASRSFYSDGTTSAFGINRFDKATQSDFNATGLDDNRPNTPSKRINQMAFGGSNVVAVGNYDYIAYSTDGGQTYTVITGVFGSGNIVGVTYGASKFVCVNSDGRVATSGDGISWTITATLQSPSAVNSAAFAAGVFLANTTNAYFHASPDGVNWTRYSYLRGVGYSNYLSGSATLIVNGFGSGEILTST